MSDDVDNTAIQDSQLTNSVNKNVLTKVPWWSKIAQKRDGKFFIGQNWTLGQVIVCAIIFGTAGYFCSVATMQRNADWMLQTSMWYDCYQKICTTPVAIDEKLGELPRFKRARIYNNIGLLLFFKSESIYNLLQEIKLQQEQLASVATLPPGLPRRKARERVLTERIEALQQELDISWQEWLGLLPKQFHVQLPDLSRANFDDIVKIIDEIYTISLHHYSNYLHPNQNLGMLYLNLKRYSQAHDYLVCMRELSQDKRDAAISLSRAYIGMNMHELALKTVLPVLGITEDININQLSKAEVMSGTAMLRLGQLENALHEFNSALETFRNNDYAAADNTWVKSAILGQAQCLRRLKGIAPAISFLQSEASIWASKENKQPVAEWADFTAGEWILRFSDNPNQVNEIIDYYSSKYPENTLNIATLTVWKLIREQKPRQAFEIAVILPDWNGDLLEALTLLMLNKPEKAAELIAEIKEDIIQSQDVELLLLAASINSRAGNEQEAEEFTALAKVIDPSGVD